jgi:hypothetical protein
MEYLQNETDTHYWESSVVPNFFSVRGFIMTPQVRQGYFWFICNLSVHDTDGNAQGISIALVSPDQFGALRTTLQNSVLQMSPSPGMILLAPMTGCQSGLVGWINTGAIFSSTTNGGGPSNFLGSGAVPIWHDSSFIIPSGWGLCAFENNNIVSGISHTIAMRLLYREIRNECLPLLWD